MRYLFGFLCACALGVVPLVGCSETAGAGGSGGSAGVDGLGGYSGYPTLCDGVDCNDDDECTDDACNYVDGTCEHTPANCDDDNECTDDACNPLDGCHYTTVDDGTSCGDGAAACEAGSCIGMFACTEAGIRHAIDVGGGPHTFDCGGPRTVATESEIIIDNDVILDAEGNLTVDAGYHGGELTGDEHRVFSVNPRVTAELRRFTVVGGHGFRGGGIRNDSQAVLTLKDTTVSGNSGEYGGIDSSGTLTLIDSTVSGNSGVVVGGISNAGGSDALLTLIDSTVSRNSGVAVGGIRSSNGVVVMANSTVSQNTGGDIGGILNINFSAAMSFTNSTVSGNTGSFCDGVNNEGRTGTGTVAITGSTMLGDTRSVCANVLYTGKTAGDPGLMENVDVGAGGSGGGGGGAGGFGGWPGKFTLANSLILGDCDADITSNGYNIESPGDTCGFDQRTDQINVTEGQLNLGPLADNGGPTMTHALLTDPVVSVAVDQIPEAACVDADGEPLTEDQRSVTRPQGLACDVGAFELEQ